MFSLERQNTKHVFMFLFGSLLSLILEAGFCDCGFGWHTVHCKGQHVLYLKWSYTLPPWCWYYRCALLVSIVKSFKYCVQRSLSLKSCKAFSPTDIKGVLEYIMSYKNMLWNIEAGMIVLIQLSTKYQNYVFVPYFSWAYISGMFSYYHISWNLCLKKWL